MNPEEWLRVRALELAVQALADKDRPPQWEVVRLAQDFLDFLKTGKAHA
jgi:hypothetical protein